jgi:hypothetical protein
MNFEISTMVPTWVGACSTQPTFACEEQGDRDDDEFLHTDCLSRNCSFLLFTKYKHNYSRVW